MKPQQINIKDYTYVLPPDRIAQHPLPERDASRLLVYREGTIEHTVFRELPSLLPAHSLLVFNDTRVIQARLIGTTDTGAHIEVFLLHPHEPYTDLQLAMFQHGRCRWRCLVGNARRWRTDTLELPFQARGQSGRLTLRKSGRMDGDFLIDLSWTPEELPLLAVLESTGHVPLPPYIKRTDTPVDRERYQTIFGFRDGSVASPTASLHFSEAVMNAFKKNNIRSLYVTLHISAGTFLPVRADKLGQHVMHEEQACVHRHVVEQLLLHRKQEPEQPLVSIGTTAMRTLESLHWLGRRILRGQPLQVGQWDPYDEQPDVSVSESLAALLDYMQQQDKNQLLFPTSLLIAPGYRYRLVNVLLTNFHLPQSTLLLLVAAFVGEDWKRIYDYALRHDFRFLSYGDASLLFSAHRNWKTEQKK